MTEYTVPFDPNILEYIDGSDVLESILDALKQPEEHIGPENLILNGEFASLVFRLGQRRKGKINYPIKNSIDGLDIILSYYDELPDNIESLLERESKIRESLSNVLNLDMISLNIEILKISEVKTHLTFFGTRPLTIDQVFMFVNESSEWDITYSKRCWRDFIERAGIVNPFGPRMMRIDCGRRMLTNEGIFHLIDALATKKVRKIWLPKWQIIRHLIEMERIGQKPLGNYLSALVCKYKNENSDIQERLLDILKILNIVSMSETYENLVKQTEDDKEFHFKYEKIPFEEHLNILVDDMYERREARRVRDRIRNLCTHEWQSFICNDCGDECRMRKCAKPKCTAYHLPHGIQKPDELRCNKELLTGNWWVMHDKDFICL